ncbi:MAG: CAP domain-containing protein [Akkermansiaceae bacterium]|nr:CAP domain-containing protein [Akkermansiaceae bacterium]
MITRNCLPPLAAMAFAVASCGSTIPMPPSTPAELSRAGDLHQAVNAYRGSRALKPLQRHSGLDQLASRHSEFMRVNRGKFKGPNGPNLSHEGFEYRMDYARHQFGIQRLAENVAYSGGNGPGTVGALTKAWTNSSLHRENMTEEWAVTGIGIRIDADGTVFATQLFGTSPSAQSQLDFANKVNRRF